MTTTVRGTIQKGQGKAQDTLAEQLPLFADCFPEVNVCHPGTLNILLEKPVVVLVPDYTSPPIPWHPGFKLVKSGEVFQFVRIRLKIDDPGCPGAVPAWIYLAQFSPYRQNPFYAEVIAPKLAFTGTPACELIIQSPCQEGLVVMAAGEPGPVGSSNRDILR